MLLKLRAAVTSTMVLSLRPGPGTPSSADLAGDPGGFPASSRGMITEINRAHITSPVAVISVAMNNDYFCK